MIILALIALAYVFIGSMIGGRHHALSSAKCEWKDGKNDRYGDFTTCLTPGWCNHIYMSLWVYGVVWPVALPATAGFLIGTTTKQNRTDRRRADEIAEAKHKAEVARLARIEDEELTLQLEATRKRA